MEKHWYVEVLEFVPGELAKDKLEKTLGPFSSERRAERCENGLMINMNHEKFYTRIVEK